MYSTGVLSLFFKLLVLKKDCSQATIQEVLDNFTSLLERVQGMN